MRLPANAPVVAIDIDGTIADYYKHFQWFAEIYLQKTLNCEFNREYRGEFNEALGLDKDVYRAIKLAYRQGGMKRSIKPFENAGNVIRNIRSLGVQVWICTTRPWNRLDNIDPDTTFWLNNNVGRVDGVIYGEDKYRDLIDIVGKDRILGVLDDLPENYATAQSLGLSASLMAGPHNEWFRETMGEEMVHISTSLVEFQSRHFSQWYAAYEAPVPSYDSTSVIIPQHARMKVEWTGETLEQRVERLSEELKDAQFNLRNQKYAERQASVQGGNN